eukprot:gene30841-37266_t
MAARGIERLHEILEHNENEETTSLEVSLEEITLDELVAANGEHLDIGDQILSIADDPNDPPILFGWSPMRSLVDLLNNGDVQVNAPAQPFQIPLIGVVDEIGLRMAIINHVRVPGSAQPIGCTCLPCTGAEGLTTSGRLIALCYHPWMHFQAAAAAQAGVAVFPLAELYIPRPRSVTVDRFNAPAPPGGLPLWTR